jgi:hypothetical protein
LFAVAGDSNQVSIRIERPQRWVEGAQALARRRHQRRRQHRELAKPIRAKAALRLRPNQHGNAGKPGMYPFLAKPQALSASAAMATRPRATVSGGSSRTATSMKKNDPPHTTERVTRSSHSLALMVGFIAAFSFAGLPGKEP